MPYHDYVNVDDANDILIDAIFISVHDEVPQIIERGGNKYKHKAHFPGVVLKGGDWTGGPAAPGQTFMSSKELKETKENEAIRKDKVAEFKETKAKRWESEDTHSLTEGVQGKLRKIQQDAARKKRDEWKTNVPQ